MSQITIVQPYVPTYRVPLFRELEKSLSREGHILKVVAGVPPQYQADRQDQAEPMPLQVDVPTRHLRFSGLTASLKPTSAFLRTSDLVICQLGSGVLENYRMALKKSVRFATWGHGFSVSGTPNLLDTTLEAWMMRRSRHFFAYTERGREAARRAGMPDEQITVLNNTIDTSELELAKASLTQQDAVAFQDEHGLAGGPVMSYIGGLDGTKRVDFLLDAARRLADRLPGFVLLVAGDGPDRRLIERAGEPFIRYLGVADAPLKARMAAASCLLLNPGRVGLIAVDSFALGIPIATTAWAAHAPEFEYLEHDRTAIVTADRLDQYCDAVERVVHDPVRLERISRACGSRAELFSLDEMVNRFTYGISSALMAPAGAVSDRERRR